MGDRLFRTSVVICLACLAVGCGDDGTQPEDGPTGFEGFSSQNPSCGGLSGATAVYFDFESGLPVTIPFQVALQSTGGTVGGGDGSFWAFPPGYAGQPLPQGVIIQRNDQQVFFKHTTNEPLGVPPETAFQNQLSAALATFGFNPGAERLVCGSDIVGSVGGLPRRIIAGLVQAGQFTFLVKVDVIVAPTATAALSVLASKVAIGPTAEYGGLSGDVFLPMVWAQYPGGRGPPPQCSDMLDNDGDGATDFGSDPQCTDPNDNDERN